MMKKVILFMVFILCIMIPAGCAGKNSADPEKQNEEGSSAVSDQEASEETKPGTKTMIRVAALKGPTAIGMVKLMDDASRQEAVNDYDFVLSGTADEISAGLMKGDFDAAAVPCNLASVLYNKMEGQIRMAGINTLGVLYIVETGDSIKSVEDLKGRTIYSTGYGTTPQYTLNYLLSSHGIDPEKDVTIEYKTESTEVAALLSEAENAVAMLPQPYVTTVLMNNDKLRIALDVAEEWDAVSKGKASVVTGVVVIRKEFLEENPDAVQAFLKEYKKSTDYVNGNVQDAAALVEKAGIFKAAVAEKAIPDCSITFIDGEDMKDKVSGYLSVLFEQNPKSIGGQLPGDDFYYIP